MKTHANASLVVITELWIKLLLCSPDEMYCTKKLFTFRYLHTRNVVIYFFVFCKMQENLLHILKFPLVLRNSAIYYNTDVPHNSIFWCWSHFFIGISLVQAETHDGIKSDHTGDVIHKNDKDYGFVCLNKDQSHGLCHNYRVRFLCGKLGMFITCCLVLSHVNSCFFMFFTLYLQIQPQILTALIFLEMSLELEPIAN